jgi:hypothetical protein
MNKKAKKAAKIAGVVAATALVGVAVSKLWGSGSDDIPFVKTIPKIRFKPSMSYHNGRKYKYDSEKAKAFRYMHKKYVQEFGR